MILVRDIFQVKFGKSKEATNIWKQGLAIIAKKPFGRQNARLLSDLVGGPYYTLIMESTFDSLAQWEAAGPALRAEPEWKAWYPQVLTVMDSGRREILSVVE
jgi:hypothetical protein